MKYSVKNMELEKRIFAASADAADQRLGGQVFLSTAAAFSYLTEQAAEETWSI